MAFIHSDPAADCFDLRIYDLSGRLLTRIAAAGSNTILWRPGKQSAKCLAAVATVGQERLVTRFMLKQ